MTARDARPSTSTNSGQTRASGDVDANGDVVSALTERLRRAIGDDHTAWPVDPAEHLELVLAEVLRCRDRA